MCARLVSCHRQIRGCEQAGRNDGIGTVRLGPPDERGPREASWLRPEQFAPPGAREVLKYRRVGPEVRVYLDDRGYVTCVRYRAESARWLGWGERDG